jgi:hypothetical protein
VTLLVLSAPFLVACEEDAGDQVLAIEARGAVGGVVFFDANGSGTPDGGDTPLAGVEVELVAAGTSTVVDDGITDTEGQFLFESVPVGTFDLRLDESELGDTLVVVGLDSAHVVIPMDGEIQRDLGVSYPTVTVEEARALPVGMPVFVEGITLAGPDVFNDNTMHIRGEELALRSIRTLRAALFPGDSVRLRGRTANFAGQPVLSDVTTFLFSGGIITDPRPTTLSTEEAAVALDGLMDADLARIEAGVVTDTFSVEDDFVAVVDDGSGPLELVLDRDVDFGFGSVPPGATFRRATGVLVPAPEGSSVWQLKPRSRFDIDVIPPGGVSGS